MGVMTQILKCDGNLLLCEPDGGGYSFSDNNFDSMSTDTELIRIELTSFNGSLLSSFDDEMPDGDLKFDKKSISTMKSFLLDQESTTMGLQMAPLSFLLSICGVFGAMIKGMNGVGGVFNSSME